MIDAFGMITLPKLENWTTVHRKFKAILWFRLHGQF